VSRRTPHAVLVAAVLAAAQGGCFVDTLHDAWHLPPGEPAPPEDHEPYEPPVIGPGEPRPRKLPDPLREGGERDPSIPEEEEEREG
jgi:hypothetical protein